MKCNTLFRLPRILRSLVQGPAVSTLRRRRASSRYKKFRALSRFGFCQGTEQFWILSRYRNLGLFQGEDRFNALSKYKQVKSFVKVQTSLGLCLGTDKLRALSRYIED